MAIRESENAALLEKPLRKSDSVVGVQLRHMGFNTYQNYAIRNRISVVPQAFESL